MGQEYLPPDQLHRWSLGAYASFLFTVEDPRALTVESLSALELLDSPIGMLVIGSGRRAGRVPTDVRAWLERRGSAVESLATPHACSTFNFMVQEQRPVAAILLPLLPAEVGEKA